MHQRSVIEKEDEYERLKFSRAKNGLRDKGIRVGSEFGASLFGPRGPKPGRRPHNGQMECKQRGARAAMDEMSGGVAKIF